MHRSGFTFFLVLLLGMAAGGVGGARAEVLLLEKSLPAPIVQQIEAASSAASRNGAPAVDIKWTEAAEADDAIVQGQVFMTALPVDRFAERVSGVDLFSVPFLFEDLPRQEKILSRDSDVRVAFDTSVMAFDVRILALLPVGYEGLAFTGSAIDHPNKMVGQRILADGPSERGFSGALEGVPVMRGSHGSAILAPWEMSGETYQSYLDLRQSPSLIALVVHEPSWQAMSEDARQAWLQAAQTAETQSRDALERMQSDTLTRLRNAGVDIVSVDQDTREYWRGATAGLARYTYLGEGRQLARVFLRAVDRTQSAED